jgi:hypothetical protein
MISKWDSYLEVSLDMRFEMRFEFETLLKTSDHTMLNDRGYLSREGHVEVSSVYLLPGSQVLIFEIIHL